MTPLSSILVATDFSLDWNNAVRRAVQLAHEHSARLRLLHVGDPAGCKALRNSVQTINRHRPQDLIGAGVYAPFRRRDRRPLRRDHER